jgi:catechol 2,3-dioxygenase-like lactoylglutathione lyase family enzyme
MSLLRAIPALPVKDVVRSRPFYRDLLGFTCLHEDAGFAIFRRGDAELHLWAADDEGWRARSAASPVISGAESFIAGTASCRIEVVGVDDLHRELQPLNILHPNAPLSDQPWGTREFGVLDPDNNLITFFERV